MRYWGNSLAKDRRGRRATLTGRRRTCACECCLKHTAPVSDEIRCKCDAIWRKHLIQRISLHASATIPLSRIACGGVVHLTIHCRDAVGRIVHPTYEERSNRSECKWPWAHMRVATSMTLTRNIHGTKDVLHNSWYLVLCHWKNTPNKVSYFCRRTYGPCRISYRKGTKNNITNVTI